MASGPNLAAAQLRELADDELSVKLRESKEELFNLRFQSATGQLDNNRRLRVVRHEIARIYTVLRERELGIVPAFTPVAEIEEAKAAKAKAKKAAEPVEAEAAAEVSEAKQDTPKKDEVDA